MLFQLIWSKYLKYTFMAHTITSELDFQAFLLEYANSISIQFNSILIYLSRVKYVAVIADFYTALQNNTNTKINK